MFPHNDMLGLWNDTWHVVRKMYPYTMLAVLLIHICLTAYVLFRYCMLSCPSCLCLTQVTSYTKQLQLTKAASISRHTNHDS